MNSNGDKADDDDTDISIDFYDLDVMIKSNMYAEIRANTKSLCFNGRLMTNWRLQGFIEGRDETHDDMRGLLIRQITRRFGFLYAELQPKIRRLSAAQTIDLGVALFDFGTLADVEAWLANQK